MNSPLELLDRAKELGLRLQRRGDKLAVSPAQLCPPEFAIALRQHKRELLDYIEAKAAGVQPEIAPWYHIAKQIMAGEFDRCDGSTRTSLTIGLRRIPHPIFETALHRLWPNGIPDHLRPR